MTGLRFPETARRAAIAILALPFLAPASLADPQPPRMIADEEAALWNGVGRLHVAGNRICTATLISPDEVLTAAHCLFHPVTGHRAHAEDIRFVAGLRRDSYAALRKAIATAVLPEFVDEAGIYIDHSQVGFDLALVKLDAPIDAAEASPLAPIDWPGDGRDYAIVGYGRDRPLIAAIRDGCGVVGHDAWTIALDCPSVAGLSGAPLVLLQEGQPRLAAVVSATTGTIVAPDGSVAAVPAERLEILRRLLQ